MRKWTALSISLLITGPLLIACSCLFIICSAMGCAFMDQNHEVPIEMAAYGSLSDEEKAYIPVSPKDAIVERITVNDDIRPYMDRGYTGDRVYAVTFRNTEAHSKDKLTVFVSLDKKTVVGKGFIDG